LACKRLLKYSPLLLELVYHHTQKHVQIKVVYFLPKLVLEPFNKASDSHVPFLNVACDSLEETEDLLSDLVMVFELDVGITFFALQEVLTIRAQKTVGVQEELLTVKIIVRHLLIPQIRMWLRKQFRVTKLVIVVRVSLLVL